MEPLAVLAAAAAGAATLLVILGAIGGSSGAAVDRLESYGKTAQLAPKAPKAERRSVGQVLGGSAIFASLNRIVERRTWSDEIAKGLARADLSLKPAEYLALRVAAIVGAVALTAVAGTALPGLRNPLALVVAGVIGFFIPRVWVGRRQQRRLRAFNAGLADTITLLANALRSGSSLLQAVTLVVRETQPPISTEFNRVVREVNLGLSFDQAIGNMVRRVRSDDLELMTTAIGIQHQAGGNLAEILDSIAFTIRERVRIKGEIRTLTAQQRVSGYVVGFLPIALMGVVSVVSPRFMAPMFGEPIILGVPLGVIFLTLGGVLMSIGFAAIRRIVDIRV